MSEGNHIQHLREEWDKIEAERRNDEDEASARRKEREEIVPAGPLYVVRDSFGIHPDEQTDIQTCVDRINQRYQELAGMPRRVRDLLFEIGAELLDLKSNKVYPDKWTDFCAEKFKGIGQRQIQRYMQLAENRSWLEAKYQKTESADSFLDWPPMNRMIEDIQEYHRNQREAQGMPPIKHRSATNKKRASRAPEPEEKPPIDVKTEVVSSADSGKDSESLPPSPPPPFPEAAYERFLAEQRKPQEPQAIDPEPQELHEPERDVEQENVDKETDAARYCADDLKKSAPRFWARLCPECQAILTGEEK
jgi:hypothetical protein